MLLSSFRCHRQASDRVGRNLFAHVVERRSARPALARTACSSTTWSTAPATSTWTPRAPDEPLDHGDGIVGSQYLKGPSSHRTTKPFYIRTHGADPVGASSQIWLETTTRPIQAAR